MEKTTNKNVEKPTSEESKPVKSYDVILEEEESKRVTKLSDKLYQESLEVNKKLGLNWH